MTVVATSHSFMATVVPGIVYLTHYVTVDTCLRIVGKIGKPLSVDEGVPPETKDSTGYPYYRQDYEW